MCEILFRGKRQNGQWTEGNLLFYPDVNRAYIQTGDYFKGGAIEVDRASVSQYTGLTDKNGVKIFEGDIIAGEGSRAKTDHFVIRWSTAICGFSAGEGRRVWPNLNQATVSGYEVIGNVHDNLEPLEGGGGIDDT